MPLICLRASESLASLSNFLPRVRFGKLFLDLPDTTSIEDFETDPFDPSPGSGYLVSVTVYPCIPEGSDGVEVTVTVVGSDGYYDQRRQVISSPATLALNVLGAQANIRDFITIRVGDMKKVIAVVF